MAETIRQRIEAAKTNDWLNAGNPRLALMDILWKAGNLIPGDEHDAAIAAAYEAGMERAAVIDASVYFRSERERQKDVEGWTEEHDDGHTAGELARAAASYALSAAGHRPAALGAWPWREDVFKPTTPLRDMARAGALLMAEIERRQRAAVRADLESQGGG